MLHKQKGTTLTKEEILDEIYKQSQLRDYYDSKQLSLKTNLNALYGSLSLPINPFAGHSEYFSLSVTSSGRIANRLIAEEQSIEVDRLSGHINDDRLSNIVQADTDSVVGSTLLNVNGESISIENLFERTDGEIIQKRENDFVKIPVSNLITPSLNRETKSIEYKKILHIMKHKVSKRLYKITCLDKEIVVTEDHSCIVFRNGSFLDISPKNFQKTDLLIKINQTDT
jgi:hypothetical protein